jgi:hypothetical protein
VPPGLCRLTPAQLELAEQLRVDPDLLAAAAELDIPARDRGAALRDGLAALPKSDLVRYLLRVADGEAGRVVAELNRLTCPAPSGSGYVRRSIRELRQRARLLRHERLRLEEEARERHRREQEAKRRESLQRLLERAETAWAEADALGCEGKGPAYDKATELVRDLAAAYALADRGAEFEKRLQAFRETHGRRPALLRRLDELKRAEGSVGRAQPGRRFGR